MKIDLDEKYCIVLNQWGNPVLVKHGKKFEFDKHGAPVGKKFFFQTFGQAVKSYIKQSAGTSDVNSFEELAAFIDDKLKGVELKINQIMEDSKNNDQTN